MFMRRAPPEIIVESYPEREESDEMALCPPHDFQAAWATPPDSKDHDDTVPALFCAACGDIRAFRLSE